MFLTKLVHILTMKYFEIIKNSCMHFYNYLYIENCLVYVTRDLVRDKYITFMNHLK